MFRWLPSFTRQEWGRKCLCIEVWHLRVACIEEDIGREDLFIKLVSVQVKFYNFIMVGLCYVNELRLTTVADCPLNLQINIIIIINRKINPAVSNNLQQK